MARCSWRQASFVSVIQAWRIPLCFMLCYEVCFIILFGAFELYPDPVLLLREWSRRVSECLAQDEQGTFTPSRGSLTSISVTYLSFTSCTLTTRRLTSSEAPVSTFLFPLSNLHQRTSRKTINTAGVRCGSSSFDWIFPLHHHVDYINSNSDGKPGSQSSLHAWQDAGEVCTSPSEHIDMSIKSIPSPESTSKKPSRF